MKPTSRKPSIPPIGRTLFALGAILLFRDSAQAATDSWTGATSVNWNASNWGGVGANNPPVSGDSLIFGASNGSGLTLTDNLMTPATFNVAGITFTPDAVAFIINPNSAGTNGFTLTGSIVNNSVNLETIKDLITISGTQSITTGTGGGNIALGGIISGTQIIAKGGGNLILSGVNTFTGSLIVESGTVTGTTSANAFGANANVIVLGDANTTAAGATLIGNNATYANPITTTAASGTNALIIGDASGVATTFSGSLNLGNNLTIDANGAVVSVTSGTITGSGNIITNSVSTGDVLFNAKGTGGSWTGSLIVNSGSASTNGNNAFDEANMIQVNSGAAYFLTTALTTNSLGGISNDLATGSSGAFNLTQNIDIGSANNVSFSGTLNTTASNTLVKFNSGTQTFSGPVIAFNVQVDDGVLNLSAPGSFSIGNATLTIGTNAAIIATGSSQTGPATLLISGNYTITQTSGNAIKLDGGNTLGTTGTSGGSLSLQDGSINTLFINNTSGGTPNTINVAPNTSETSSFNMDVGNNSADEIITLQSGDKISTPGTSGQFLLNINGLGGITSAGSAVIVDGSGGGINATLPILSATTGNFSGFTTLTVTDSTTSITVHWSNQAATPGTVYWDNAAPSGSGSWAALTGGTFNYSNWSTTASGTLNPQQIPGPATNVIFNGDNGTANTTVSLNSVTAYSGTTFSINSVTFLSPTGAMTISGTNTLTVGSGGLTVSSGSNDTISANVALGTPQTWSVTSGTLSITGSLIGNNGLTVSGPGTVVLGGNNANFTGGLTISSGTVELNNAGALNSSAPEAVTFGVSSTGALSLNGNNVAISSLSSDPTATAAVIQNANVSTSGTLTVDQSGSSAYSGILQDGAGSTSLALTLSSGTLNLAGANTYSGATTINGGDLYISGSLGASSLVSVNSGGLLSGTGGKVGGAVTINNGGTIGAGTAGAPGTMNLGNGLTINSGGIAVFNIINGGANDEIEITGSLTLDSGAIIRVPVTLTTTGTYILFTYTAGSDPNLVSGGILEQNLSGGSLGNNFQFIASGGTLELKVTPPTVAFPSLTITTPATGTRVMSGTTEAIQGVVTNSGPIQLNGTFSDSGLNLAVSGFNQSSGTVAANSSGTFGAIVSTGATLGSRTYGVTITDGNASPTSNFASSTLTVLANRVVISSTAPNFGTVHAGSTVAATITLSSTGADNNYTRVTVGDSSFADANGISVTGGNPITGTFNGSFSDTRSVGGAITTLGTYSGTITLTTTGEGLVGEAPVNVPVIYSAQVFSGTAAWNLNASSSWATNGNWSDTSTFDLGNPGAPGLAGAASIGDMAIFNQVAGQGGILTVSLNGASPSLAGITFTSSSGYTIAPGTGGAISLQGAATPISVTTGSDTISAVLTGNGFNKTGSGALAINGTNTYTGSTQISQGVLQLTGSALPASTVVTLGDNSNDSGQLVLGNSGTVQSITVAGLQTAGSGASNSVVGGGASGTATLTVNMTTVGTYTYGGVLGGAGTNQNLMAVTISGTGTQIFSGVSAYTGTTQILSGTLGLAANQTFSGTTLTGGPIGTGTLFLNVSSGTGGIIAIGSARSIDNVIILDQNNTTFSGNNAITLNGTAGYFALTGGDDGFVNNDTAGVTLAGPIYLNNSVVDNPSGVQIAGTGVTTITGSIAATTASSGTSLGLFLKTSSEVILANANSTYSGNTQADSGVLVIAAGDTVSSGTVAKGALGQSTLELMGGSVMAGASPETVDNLVSVINSSTIGGGSNLTFTNVISGTVTATLTIIGPGKTILSNTETYSGTTNITSGNLEVDGSMPGVVNVNPSGGTATLSGTGAIGGAVTTLAPGGNTPHIAPGVNTTGAFGGNFGGVGTLTLNGGLTIGNGTDLDFDLGTSSDLIAVTGPLSLGTGVTLNISPGSGFSATTVATYTLITYTGGLVGSTAGWGLTGMPAAMSGSFSSAGGAVTVTFTPTAAPANAYWGGAQGSGGNGTWNTITAGAGTNWLTALNGGVDTNQVPYGGSTNVFFIADTGSNAANTFLGANTIINSLNFTGTDAAVTTGSAVTITGSIAGSGTNNSLTINASGTNGNAAGSGITMGLGAGAVTINAPLVLGGNQTWTLNATPSSPLTIGGTLSGAHALAVGGIGELILGGNNTFTGGLTINGSVNVVLNSVGALNTASPDSVAFGPSSTGTLNLNGFSVVIGSLSSNAGSPVIQNNGASAVVFTVGQAASGTYAGVIQDGTGASLSLVMAGPAALTLTGANTYSGSTSVTGGDLQVNGSLGSIASVTVGSSGTLGGSGGTIHGAVTIASGGEITATAGTGNAPGTLTLDNGLTINSGGIAAFNLVNGGANDLIRITSGGITLISGAILQVAPFITVGGTYALMTYTGPDPSLTGITEQDLGGGALQFNYSFVASGGTLDLVVVASPLAVANIVINSPVSGSRVMSGTSLVVSGTVSNPGTTNTLTGTLTDAGRSLTVGNINSGTVSVVAGGAQAFSGTIASTGVILGNQTYGVTVTDGASINTSATASGTVDVVQNRIVSGSGIPNYGAVHLGTVVSTTITLSSTGADNQNTRVTVADSGADAFGISISGGNPSGTFNGSFTDTRLISGTFSSTGTDNGITLITTGEGLPGEAPHNVNVGFTAEVFSGHASWNGAGNSSWSTSANWGDTNISSPGTIGAPGLSGALSLGDTALFADYGSEGSTTTVNLDGVSPSLAGLTFSSTNTIYTIATGPTPGGVLNMQSGATMSVTTGTGIISGTIAGTGPLTVSTAAGSDLIWSGSDTYTGFATVTSGTLTLQNPAWLGQNAGTNVYKINSGAVLQLSTASGTYTTDAVKDNTYIEGSGTLQISGGGFYISDGLLSIQMSAGGVIEVTSGATLGNGGNGPGGVVWTNNLGSLQLDSGGSINAWDNAPVTVDALTGSGTVNRIGFGNGGVNGGGGENFIVGANNGSGTFNGTVTNSLGQLNFTKAGSGTEALTGANSYAGSTAVTGGVLKITNGSGLGFGGPAFVAQGGQFTTTVSGGTLDINGGITVNNAITLNGGSLINSAAGTTSVLASGVAGVTFTTDPNVAGAVVVTISGGSGSGATASGGSVSTANFSQVSGNAGANNTANDYLQMATAGSGYLASGTGAPTVSVTINGLSDTGVDTAVVSSLTLVGNNFIGGNGNMTINAQINGAGGFTTVGTGTVTLANAETYTGPTTLGAGITLQLGTGFSYAGSIGGSGSVIVAGSGTDVLAGISTYTGPTTINAGSTLQLGNGLTDGAIVSSTVSNNGALLFMTGGVENLPAVITGTGGITMSGSGSQEISGANTYTGTTIVNSGTLQFGSPTASGSTSGIIVSGSGSLTFSNGSTAQTTNLSISGQTLSLHNGSTLSFGLSDTNADQLVISNGAVLSLSGTTFINPFLLSGTGGSYTIITDASGFQGSGTFALSPLPVLATGTLTETATSVSITFSGVSTAYWSGSNSGDWSDFTNFTSDITGTVPLSGSFGAPQDIVFSGSNAINQASNEMDGIITGHSLTINDPSGVDIGTFNGAQLILTGISGNTGITVGSAAGGLQVEIDSNLDLAGTPNITVNNTGGLLITGIITGANGLIVNGTGMLTLTGPGGFGAAANTYSGGTDLVSGTLSVNADAAFGQSGSGNGVTFNPGAGNSVTLQQNYGSPSFSNNLVTATDRTFTFATGTGVIDPGPAGSVMTISGPVLGNAALEVVDTGQLILSGSVAFNGTAYVSSGTLSLAFPGTIAQTGAIVFNTSPGGVLQLSDIAAQNISPAQGDSVAFTGSGTLQATGPGSLQLHGASGGGQNYAANGNIYMDMSGGTIEVVGGVLENGGLGSTVVVEGDPANGTGSPLWTGTYNGTPFTNLASLQIDATGTFDTWNGNNVMVDALNGSGLLTKLGYSTTDADSVVTIGDNNGSGTFSGMISNVFGTVDIVKTGTGTQIFAGNNSYSGSTLVTGGGTLRVTSNTGLGNGGPIYFLGNNKSPNGSVTVNTSSTLDLNGGVTVDKAITLNAGSLVNSGTGTSILDNGVAAVVLNGTQVGTYTTPALSDTAAPGNGSGAAFTAGSGSAPTSGISTVFGEVTAPGTGYTVAPTLAFTDSTGTGSGVTATAVLSSLSLQGNPTLNFIGGNGNLTINAVISGTSGFSTTGTGTLTLTGSNTYAGATTVASGIMNNNGYITGVVNVNPNTGAPSTLSGTGTFGGLVSTAAASGLNVAHIAPGVNTSGNFGGIGTLTLKNGLTIGNGTNLDFDLGTSSDLIAVTGALSLGSGVTLNVSQAAGFGPGTYDLITYTGALSGNTSSWSVTGAGADNATFTTNGGIVAVTFTVGANDSQLSITPATISLGSVLVGFTPSSTTGTLGNASGNGSPASYTTVATGSASISPANGALAANSSTALTVGASSPINLTSGNNQVIGTVYATNNSNVSGSAAAVNVTANVFQQFSGTTPTSTSASGTAALTLTNLASTDGGQRAGVTISGFSTSNANFVATGTNGALVATANGSNVTATVANVTTATNLLDGNYTFSGSVTGTAGYTNAQLATQASVANQVWSNVTVTASVSGNSSNARTNVFSAQIQSGSTYAGYSLSSSVLVSGTSQHPNTGSGGTTVATLLAGTASATTTVSMSFDSAPAPGNGPDDTGFRTSDILTLTGIHQVGTAVAGSLTVTLTDKYVLQLSYDTSATALTELIGQNTGSIWVNAADLNSSDATEQLYANESYATYVAGTAGGDTPALGAYGYDAGVAWAVLDHTGISDPISEFAVIPEPGTYAMVFSGFGMLVGFRRLRRRRSSKS